MNTWPRNNFETYRLAPKGTWNLSPDGPTQLSKFAVVDHCVEVMKLLYGTPEGSGIDTYQPNPDDEDTVRRLYLTMGWGNDNRQTIESWIQYYKLTDTHKAELGIYVNPDLGTQMSDSDDALDTSDDE